VWSVAISRAVLCSTSVSQCREDPSLHTGLRLPRRTFCLRVYMTLTLTLLQLEFSYSMCGLLSIMYDWTGVCLCVVCVVTHLHFQSELKTLLIMSLTCTKTPIISSLMNMQYVLVLLYWTGHQFSHAYSVCISCLCCLGPIIIFLYIQCISFVCTLISVLLYVLCVERVHAM